jgi:hypothetical protein
MRSTRISTDPGKTEILPERPFEVTLVTDIIAEISAAFAQPGSAELALAILDAMDDRDIPIDEQTMVHVLEATYGTQDDVRSLFANAISEEDVSVYFPGDMQGVALWYLGQEK